MSNAAGVINSGAGPSADGPLEDPKPAQASTNSHRSTGIDAAKGILILLIVAGHNTYLPRAFPEGYLSIYRFHVTAFLLLPFALSDSSLGLRELRDRWVRYGVPALWCYGLTFTLYTLSLAPQVSWRERAASFLLGLAVGSSEYFDRATGLKLLWFAPALITLVTLRSSVFRSARHVILAAGVAAHLTLGVIPRTLAMAVPGGLLIVLWVWPLGMVVAAARDLTRRLQSRWVDTLGAVCVLAFFTLNWIASFSGWDSDIGAIRIASFLNPVRLATIDLIALGGLACVIFLGRRMPLAWLVSLGRESYGIYLLHSLVFQFFIRLPGLRPHAADNPYVLFVLSFVLTVVTTFAALRLLHCWPGLYKLLFPRDLADLRTSLGSLH